MAQRCAGSLERLLKGLIACGAGRASRSPVAKTIAAATARLGERGRLVIRPSGAEPVIRVMGEANEEALVDCLVSDVCAAVATTSNENAVTQY